MKNNKIIKYISLFLCMMAILWNFTNFGYNILIKFNIRRMVDLGTKVSADISVFYSWIFLVPALILTNRNKETFLRK